MQKFHPFRLDIVNECLWRSRDDGDDERIRLTPKAFAVLRHLVEHAGRLVTQDELLDALWPDTFVQPEVLKSHIRDIQARSNATRKIPVSLRPFPGGGTSSSPPSRTWQPTQRLNNHPESWLVETGHSTT